MKRSSLWTSGLLALALVACDDAADTSSTSSSSTSTSVSSSASSASGNTTSSSSSGGGGAGGGPQTLSTCLDRPDVLLTPPDGTLPCELVPPGVNLPLP